MKIFETQKCGKDRQHKITNGHGLVGRKREYEVVQPKTSGSCKKVKHGIHFLARTNTNLHNTDGTMCDGCFLESRVCYLRGMSPKFDKIPLLYNNDNKILCKSVEKSTFMTKITS